MASKLDMIYEWTDTELSRALDDWFTRQCQNPYGMFFLYGRRGKLQVFEEPTEGFALVCQARVGPGCTKRQAFNMLRPFVQKFPCLPEELCQ